MSEVGGGGMSLMWKRAGEVRLIGREQEGSRQGLILVAEAAVEAAGTKVKYFL